MTKDEILTMKPGRELNALVAEYVLGWRKIPGPTTDYDGPCESFDVLVPPTIDDPFPLYPPRGAIKPWHFCRKWSTDISIAWEVVREMETKGWYLSIDHYKRGNKAVCFNKLTGDNSVDPGFFVRRMTTTEGICKAALLVMIGGEKA